MEIGAATKFPKGLSIPAIYFTIRMYRYKGLSALQKGVTMKGKWKIAAGIFVGLFCILLGCEKKEKQTETLMLLSAAEGEEVPEKEAETQTAVRVGEEPEQSPLPDTGLVEKPVFCVVHICGAVNCPGVYTLDSGSRIYQVVEAAGGFREDAREDYLNQADPVTDGMKIYVPTLEETREVAWTEISESTGISEKDTGILPDSVPEENSGLININTAGEALLCTLPGVGTSKAKSIIAYREANGAYQRIEDIMNVEGIKEGLFQKIRDSITV